MSHNIFSNHILSIYLIYLYYYSCMVGYIKSGTKILHNHPKMQNKNLIKTSKQSNFVWHPGMARWFGKEELMNSEKKVKAWLMKYYFDPIIRYSKIN